MRALRVLRSSLLSFPLTLFTTCVSAVEGECCQEQNGKKVHAAGVMMGASVLRSSLQVALWHLLAVDRVEHYTDALNIVRK